MTGEIWTYVATKPSDGSFKTRPVLIIGNDASNNLKFVDIHYVIISSSAECGLYDIKLDDVVAKQIGLNGASVIKTTKIYTGTKSKLGVKISDLPTEIKEEFYNKYKKYQEELMFNFINSDILVNQ